MWSIDSKASTAVVEDLSLLLKLFLHSRSVDRNICCSLNWNVESKIKNVVFILVIIELLVHSCHNIVFRNYVISVGNLKHRFFNIMLKIPC